jgi:protein-L-isoaspartate(D-aspartate) O-methyltransferase
MASVDAAVQRANMVESQVRPSDVTDRRILRAMLDIPREQFVPAHLKQLAYIDDEVPLTTSPGGARQARTLMAPRAFARLVQLAEISPSDVVLDVGCASGYSAAVLGKLAETVVALEFDPELAETASRLLSETSYDNVAVVTGELANGYPDEGPYDAIVVEGRVDEVPFSLLDQLKDGGRLVAVLSGRPSRAVLWRRLGGTFDKYEAFEAAASPLPGFKKPAAFVF